MTFTSQQKTAAMVLALNAMVLSPCVWITSYLFSDYHEWRGDVDKEIEAVRSQVSHLKTEVARDYATKMELQAHSGRINDRLINLK